MSVQHGRIQRQLLAPEKAMHRFKYMEGQAMSPTPKKHSRALCALVLVTMSGGLSTYGILTNDTNTMWTGIILLVLVFVWMLYHL